jgi:hypothetical protein
MEIREDRPNRTLPPRPDLPDYQNPGATRFNTRTRLYGRRVKMERYRVDIPGVERLRRLPAYEASRRWYAP